MKNLFESFYYNTKEVVILTAQCYDEHTSYITYSYKNTPYYPSTYNFPKPLKDLLREIEKNNREDK